MFKSRGQKVAPFEGKLRSGRPIVYGGQVWAFVVLSLMLAAMTSPLWLISPPEFMGTKQEFRLAGATFWAAVALLGLFAGRSWGVRIALYSEKRTVSREQCSPWSVKTLWSHSGDQVSHVSLSVNAEGIARLEASLKDGSTLLVEKGVNQADLRTLGNDIAGCWGVPFKTS